MLENLEQAKSECEDALIALEGIANLSATGR